jgi:hypothetical protein
MATGRRVEKDCVYHRGISSRCYGSWEQSGQEGGQNKERQDAQEAFQVNPPAFNKQIIQYLFNRDAGFCQVLSILNPITKCHGYFF